MGKEGSDVSASINRPRKKKKKKKRSAARAGKKKKKSVMGTRFKWRWKEETKPNKSRTVLWHTDLMIMSKRTQGGARGARVLCVVLPEQKKGKKAWRTKNKV